VNDSEIKVLFAVALFPQSVPSVVNCIFVLSFRLKY